MSEATTQFFGLTAESFSGLMARNQDLVLQLAKANGQIATLNGQVSYTQDSLERLLEENANLRAENKHLRTIIDCIDPEFVLPETSAR